MHVSELQTKHITELLAQAEQMGIENANRLRKQDLVFTIVRELMKDGQEFICSGTLETLPDGYGFLRSAATSYLACPDDIYVSPNQIRRFNLHTGDTIEGTVRVPKNDEKYFALVRVDSVNSNNPESSRHKILFENLTPLFPTKQLKLERENDLSAENITGRILSLIHISEPTRP
ncbi:Rho termination factor N-terminal domain-containing protein, partial [Kingella kingae]